MMRLKFGENAGRAWQNDPDQINYDMTKWIKMVEHYIGLINYLVWGSIPLEAASGSGSYPVRRVVSLRLWLPCLLHRHFFRNYPGMFIHFTVYFLLYFHDSLFVVKSVMNGEYIMIIMT